MTLIDKIIEKTERLVALHGVPRMTGQRQAVARFLVEHVRDYCREEVLDPMVTHSCPMCDFLDEAWFCPNCDKMVLRSEMIIGNRPEGISSWTFEFIGYCPHCQNKRPAK